MKIVTTVLLTIAVLTAACTSARQVSPSVQKQARPAPITQVPPPVQEHTRQAPITDAGAIGYNPDKLTRAQVASAITDVFASRGYKSTSEGQTGITFGVETVTPFEEGPVQSVTTESQTPIQGSDGKRWFYRAWIEDRGVELQVFVKVPPYRWGPITLDSELTSWDPPDASLLREEIQNRLQAQ